MSGQVLITGVNGFVGKHLVRELADAGKSVIGTAREQAPDPQIAELLSDYVVADLATDRPSLPSIDGVVHLAGLAAVGASFSAPADYIARNTAMTVNVCEQLLGTSTKILVVSSGAVYDAHQPMPIAESGAVAPTSPYVVSKLAVEELTRYYALRGLNTVIVRPFNHIGPMQAKGFLVPDLIEAARAAAPSGTLMTGNLATARDYTDVRDVATAYRLLLESNTGPGSVFNVASGRAVAGTEILRALLGVLKLHDLETVVDPERVRPTDAPVIVGDAGRLRRLTGWAPRFALQQTLADAAAVA